LNTTTSSNGRAGPNPIYTAIPEPPPPPAPVISALTRKREAISPNIRYVQCTAICVRCDFRVTLQDEDAVLAQVREHLSALHHAMQVQTVFTMFVYDEGNVLPDVLSVNSDGVVVFTPPETPAPTEEESSRA
jgi:predicted small metal-binding protein